MAARVLEAYVTQVMSDLGLPGDYPVPTPRHVSPVLLVTPNEDRPIRLLLHTPFFILEDMRYWGIPSISYFVDYARREMAEMMAKPVRTLFTLFRDGRVAVDLRFSVSDSLEVLSSWYMQNYLTDEEAELLPELAWWFYANWNMAELSAAEQADNINNAQYEVPYRHPELILDTASSFGSQRHAPGRTFSYTSGSSYYSSSGPEDRDPFDDDSAYEEFL